MFTRMSARDVAQHFMVSLNESSVEDAALGWFGELGYAIGHGPQMAPGEPAAERDSFGDVVLVGRLREAIQRLNPLIPEEAREEALRKVLRVGTPSLTQTNRAVHPNTARWRAGGLSAARWQHRGRSCAAGGFR
ncbi:MAG: type I restriction endonuclease [Limisphaerales bacterium]